MSEVEAQLGNFLLVSTVSTVTFKGLGSSWVKGS